MKRLSNFFTIESSSDRIFGLDLLRAFAIFFVVFLHGSRILPQHLAVYQFYFVFDGVSIFFVLSGFLIGRIIIKTFNTEHLSYHSLSSFWIKRWFRTLPNYFIILLALILLQVISGKSFNGAPLWKYFLFIQNFNSPQPDFFSESWSLSVEEWFYLLIPLFIFLLAYFGKVKVSRAVLFIAVIIILFTITLRIVIFSDQDITTAKDWDLMVRKQVITRLDGIMYGVLGAYFSKYYYNVWFRFRKIFFLIGIILLLFPKIMEEKGGWGSFYKWFMVVMSFPMMEIAILLLLPLLSEWKSSRGWIATLTTYISLTSYSIYLIHFSIVKTWLIDNMGVLGLHGTLLVIIKYILYYLLTFTIAIIMYKFFEKPFLEARKKWV